MLSATEIKAVIARATTLDELVAAEELATAERFPTGVLHVLVSRQLEYLERRARENEPR